MKDTARLLTSLLLATTAALAFAASAAAASTFQVLLESDANADPGSEVFLLTYDSLADLIAGDFSSGQFTQIGISPTFSIVGFDISGGTYSLLLESDANADPGSEVFLLTYDSLSDLIAGDFSSGTFTQIGISPAYSIAGLLSLSATGGGGSGTVTEPNMLALLSLGFLGLAAMRRRKR